MSNINNPSNSSTAIKNPRLLHISYTRLNRIDLGLCIVTLLFTCIYIATSSTQAISLHAANYLLTSILCLLAINISQGQFIQHFIAAFIFTFQLIALLYLSNFHDASALNIPRPEIKPELPLVILYTLISLTISMNNLLKLIKNP